jgi:hypothetical protein
MYRFQRGEITRQGEFSDMHQFNLISRFRSSICCCCSWSQSLNSHLLFLYFVVGIFLIWIPPIISGDNVRIRASGVQQQLLLSGASLAVFWGCSFVFGILLLSVPISLCVLVFQFSIGIQQAWATQFVLLLLTFCVSSVMFAYLITLWHQSEAKVANFVRMVTVPIP